MGTTITDFSGNNFGTDEAVNVCKMKCEMTLNETDMVKIKRPGNLNGFTVHSNLFTIKHGNQIYNLNNDNYVSNEIVHRGIFQNTYGVISELIFHCTSSGRGDKKLYIYIPIYQSFKPNANGELLKKISEQSGEADHNISDLFPRNISFYTYSLGNETSVVFTNSNIMINRTGNWQRFQAQGFTALLKSDKDHTNELNNIINRAVFRKGIRVVDADASDYNFFLNTKGVVEGGNETTIIDCQPIDDDGMLLADREKGLNQTGIAQTSNLEVIANKLMDNPLAQTAIGVILLYILTKILRTGNLMLGSKESN